MKKIIVSCIFSTFFLLFSQTVRDKAQEHFFLLDWVESSSGRVATAPVAVALQGGSESFPLLKLSQGGSSASVPPSISNIGLLDYTYIDEDILLLCTQISANLKERKIDKNLFDPKRVFLSVLLEQRLSRIEEVFSVFFSRPVSEDGGYSVRFRIEYVRTPQRKALLYTANLIQVDSTWLIDDFYSDGNSNGR